MAQDLNPISWGAQDRYQAHFIVKILSSPDSEDYLARPKLQTKGHFGSKKVTGIKWVGGELADALNNDETLKNMITRLSYEDAQISVEPTKGGVRIFGRWKDSNDFTMTKELFTVYDRIALDIRNMSGSPPVKS